MYYRSKIGKSLTLGICGVLLVTLASPTGIRGQGIDEKVSKFLLSESEMIGYELKRQSRSDWIVGEGDRLRESIRQTWIPDGADDSKDITVEICVFDSEPKAISGTAYCSGSYAELFDWGSFSGSIVGDGSWISANQSGNATIIFVRGNIGVHIGIALATEDERQALEAIAHKVLSKIEENLSPEIRSIEEGAKQKQISLERYQKITAEVVKSEAMRDFSFFASWDSKWLVDTNSFTLGIRTEWRKEQGTVVGIDICEFESNDLAWVAEDIRTREAYGYFFDMDNLSSLETVLERWQIDADKAWARGHTLSGISVKDRVAVHIYQFDPTKLAPEIFSSIAKQLASQLSF